ncbi:bacteriocin [Lactococcus garvieae]|uniref:bacteriocin n=1 Tax=Lactococcus garvieae TaxID=1363 RepID=UPI0032430B20
MKQGDIITLSDGQQATIAVGDESDNFKNIYVVRLENGDLRVVDRKTLTLAPAKKHDNFSNYGKIR